MVSRTLPEFYGLPKTTTNAALVTALQPVQKFLAVTGLAYVHLVELVKTRFVNASQAITLQVSSDQDPCDLSQTTLNGLDANALQRMHRFLRLQTAIGWSMEDLDKTIAALGLADINDALLVKLAFVSQLQKTLKLTPTQLAPFWSSLDVIGRDSLYLQVFQNKTVLNPVDPAFALSYSSPLAALPAGVTAANLASVTSSISYAAGVLQFTGAMTEDHKTQLIALATTPTDPNYSAYLLAVDNLFDGRTSSGLAISPTDPNAKISLHVPAMRGPLRIGSTDFVTMVANEKLSDTLDLPTLSQYYRFAALARALKVSVTDLSTLESLAGATLIGSTDPASLCGFVSKAQKVLRSAFSVAQLNYLYCNVADPNQGAAPLDGNVVLFLSTLQAALNKVTDGSSVIPDPAAGLTTVLQQELAAILDPATVTEILGLLDGKFNFSVPLAALPAGVTLPTGITYDDTNPANKKLVSQGAISDAERQRLKALSNDAIFGAAVDALYQQPVTFIGASLSTFLDPSDAVSQLINNPSLATADKQKYVLVRVLARTNVVKQALAGTLGLDASVTELLLDTVLKSSTGNGNAIRDFLSISAPYPDTAAWTSYQLMFKAAMLVKGFRMTANEVAYLAANGSDFANFDFSTLPVGSVQPPPAQLTALLTQWLRLYDLFTLAGSVADGEAVFDVFQAAAHPTGPPPTTAALAGKLAVATGWDNGETLILTGSTGFNLAVAEFRSEIKLLPLLSCWNLIQRLGVSSAGLFHWAGDPPDPTLVNDLKNATEIKTAARAKFDDQTWLTAGTIPISRLRDAQRTALMAYVQNALQFADSDQLFDYFLIDVNMSPCRVTSRIVQASAAVQLFVQRCLMNLESNVDSTDKENGVAASAIDSVQWETWRKYYRVSEANREVFLYPENWVEPELRDDKSPFFQDLENELLQNDVTAQTVEDAFINYLRKLDQVSRLEIVGSYHDNDADVLHVFGRTFHTPPSYYYRQYANGVWTAWESVPLDIQGDDLIPVVYERRLYLFWPIFTAKAPQQSQDASGGNIPLQHWEIQLAWARYQSGRWSAKQVSTQTLVWPQDANGNALDVDKLPAADTFVFKTSVLNQGLPTQALSIRPYIPQSLGNTAGRSVRTPRLSMHPVPSDGNRLPSDGDTPASIGVYVRDQSGKDLNNILVSLHKPPGPPNDPHFYDQLMTGTEREASGLVKQGDDGVARFLNTPTGKNMPTGKYKATLSLSPDYTISSLDPLSGIITVPANSTEEVPVTFTLQSKSAVLQHQYLPCGDFQLQACAGDIIEMPSPANLPALKFPAKSHPEGMMVVEDPPASAGSLHILGPNQEDIPVLNATPSTFRLLVPHQLAQFTLPQLSTNAAKLIGGAAATQEYTAKPDNVSFSNQQVGVPSTAQVVTLTEAGVSGGNPAISITGPNATDFSQTNTCAKYMGPGEGCTVSVIFEPSAGGPRSASLTFGPPDGSSQSVPLTGTAVEPTLNVAPLSMPFANQAIGTTSAGQAVVLTNTGTLLVIISGITVSGDFAQTNTCSSGWIRIITIVPGGSCTVNVTFSPTATGARSGTLTIYDNATDRPHNVPLTGTGEVPTVTLKPSPVGFGGQTVGTTSAPQIVTLTNTSDVVVTITNVAIAGANASDFALTNNCSGTLQPKAACTMSLTFKPSAGGSRTAALTITDNATAGAQSVPLNGIGLVPGVALFPPNLAFANQPVGTTSAPQTITLTNTGSSPLTINSIAASGDFAQTNNYVGVVVPTGSFSITVTFTPTATGTRTGTLTIQDTSAAGQEIVGLTGMGAQPALTISPTSLAFSVAAVGTTAVQPLTLTNDGTAPLNLSSIAVTGANSGDFFYSSSGPNPLPPGQTGQINVTFTPSAGGSRSAQLVLTDDAPNSPQSVNLTGTITGAAITVTPTDLTFPREAIGSASPAQVVSVTNNGGSPVTISSIAATGDFAQTNNYANQLTPGATCSISVTFKPTGGGTRTGTLTIVDSAPGSPRTVSLTGSGLYSEPYEFFYQDDQRTYFASLPQAPSSALALSSGVAAPASSTAIEFYNHFHPHICAFIESLNRDGIPGLLTLANQVLVNDTVKDHFYTTSSAERDNAVSQDGYLSEGVACYVYATQVAGTIPFYRLRSPAGDHFYTPSAAERQSLLATPGWTDEGIACYLLPAPDSDAAPLYRLSSARLGIHFYTISQPEKNVAVSIGYVVEGIPGYVFTSPVSESIPLYRLIRLATIFKSNYSPIPSAAVPPYPIEDVDFSYGGAYEIYNWELFFHAPMLVAGRLADNQKFQDAQQWYHYVFNPTLGNNPWQVLPFQTTAKASIEHLLELLEYTGTDLSLVQQRNNLENQLKGWATNPFDPHAIARLRLIAYQKNVVMKYLDNLIAWGDQLFRQYRTETVNQATQLYVMAQEILGPRPQLVPSRQSAQNLTYNDLIGKLDDFSNNLVQLENEFPFSVGPASNNGGDGLGLTGTFYFCIPNNSQLLAYWKTVADRLFKIRHCMNIDGVVSSLPLFAPPISPGLLVRAAAAGVDLSSALNDIQAATPNYRFTYMLQKAFELCSEVRSFGSSLLSALEKKDSEQIALLRATQESNLLQAALQVKQSQLDEANANLTGLQASQALVQFRQQYYQNLVDSSPSPFESNQISELRQAQDFQGASQIVNVAAGLVALIPEFNAGVSGFSSSPVSTFIFGGANLSKELELASRVLSDIAALHSHHANMSQITGGWDRRSQEWTFQAQSAARELNQIAAQITAANARIAIAQTDITNQNLQISNAQAVQEFLRSKYTNQDLYAWMISQTSSVFFQCYQLAYDMAKRAEEAFRFERGLTDSNFIAFGYWDNLKKGLLSGEQLYLDLKRLESIYLDQNKRDYEITKHISLVLTAPIALIAIKDLGSCTVDLPESLFDADYPGHYMRRLKSVSLTIPCVTGPYTSVNCTLTLLKSKVRVSTDTQPAYPEQVADGSSDPRFVYNFAATQSIATSTGQNDSGMFEVNFRDDRYLPFEGAGAISTWQITMPQDTNAFNFETISDVILNFNYTSRDGGDALRRGRAHLSCVSASGPSSALVQPEARVPQRVVQVR